jgi:protein TonB
MQVAQSSSIERAVPAVLTISLHLLILYVVAMSVGIVPKFSTLTPFKVIDIPQEDVPTLPVKENKMLDPKALIAPPIDPYGPPDLPPIEPDRYEPLVPPKGGLVIEEGGAEAQITAPRLLRSFDPPYPPVAQRRGEEGVVQVRVTIAENGAILDAQIEKSSGFGYLDDAALKAVRDWRFGPAMRGARPLVASKIVAVRFQLRR